MSTDCQIEEWIGNFGDDYTERNEFAAWKMPYGVKAFHRIINGLDIKSILEVGSNIGLNINYVSKVVKDDVKLYAIEPNKRAFKKLVSNKNIKLENVWNCDTFNLPLNYSSVDLVFTAGVLIHIHPDNLDRAIDEIVRIARKYVLCIEYFSHEPAEIKYRGQNGLLFKRDFGGYYLDRFPNLECIRYGFLWEREFKIFDNLTWWLFEKNQTKI